MNYYEIPSLSNIFLEDSYVLGVHEFLECLVFELDVVVSEGHPSYAPPNAGEKYCYRQAFLSFSKIGSYYWLEKNFLDFLDATKEVDFGNIDTFSVSDDCYVLSGDWGRLAINHAFIEFFLVVA